MWLIYLMIGGPDHTNLDVSISHICDILDEHPNNIWWYPWCCLLQAFKLPFWFLFKLFCSWARAPTGLHISHQNNNNKIGFKLGKRIKKRIWRTKICQWRCYGQLCSIIAIKKTMMIATMTMDDVCQILPWKSCFDS